MQCFCAILGLEKAARRQQDSATEENLENTASPAWQQDFIPEDEPCKN